MELYTIAESVGKTVEHVRNKIIHYDTTTDKKIGHYDGKFKYFLW